MAALRRAAAGRDPAELVQKRAQLESIGRLLDSARERLAREKEEAEQAEQDVEFSDTQDERKAAEYRARSLGERVRETESDIKIRQAAERRISKEVARLEPGAPGGRKAKGPAMRAAKKAARKPARKAGRKAAKKKTARKPARKAGRTAKGPARRAARKPARKAGRKAAKKKAARKPARKAAKRPAGRKSRR